MKIFTQLKLMLLLGFSLVITSAFAQTIVVDPCNGGNTMQDALDDLTTTNQTILVEPSNFTNQSPGGNWGLSTFVGSAGLYDGLTIDFQGSYIKSDAAGLGLLDISGINNMTIRNLTLDGFNRSNGAINVDNTMGTVFENVNFVNSPTTQPMSMSADSGNTEVTFNNCTFSGNPTTSSNVSNATNSGAVLIDGHLSNTIEVTFNGCAFRCNGRDVDGGGAVQIRGDQDNTRTSTMVTFNNCEFANNNISSAGTGGGAISAVTEVTLNITGCTFYNNTVFASSGLSSGGGGAIMIFNRVTMNIADSYFTDNTVTGGSADGGAIGTNAGGSSGRNTVTITNSVFTGNSCTDEGGGVFFRHADVTATNCLFANNNSPDGGAFHIENAGNYVIDGLTSTGTSGKDFENNSGSGSISNSIITGSNTMGSLSQTNNTIGGSVTFTNPMPSGTTDPETYSYDVAGSQGTSIGVMPAVVSNTDCPAEAFAPPVGVAPCAPLPVELAAFYIKNIDCNANLYWSTLSEDNSSHFEIEKSFNGRDFERVGEVAAAGNSAEMISYSFDDGENRKAAFYRLKVVDIDGSFEYTEVVSYSVDNCGKSVTIQQVYPSPVKETLQLELVLAQDAEIEIRVIDVTGRVVINTQENLQQGLNNKGFDVSQLGNGVYYLQVVSLNTNELSNTKFVKM